jgi:hypothetical protein
MSGACLKIQRIFVSAEGPISGMRNGWSSWWDDPLIPAFSPWRRRISSSVLAMANVRFAEHGSVSRCNR